MAESIVLPGAFAQVVSDSVENILAHQQADGAIVYDPAAPIVYPQQAIMPLAFCYAGLGTKAEHKNSHRLAEAIRRLGNYLVGRFDDEGRVHFDSWGHDVHTVDQRLTYAWVEAVRMLQESGADMPYDRWGDKILRACNHLIEKRMRKLVGVRRFISRVLGTSTNHAALYVTTVYRAGQVLKKPEMCAFSLPIGRALAADIHSDGYWEEHGDLLRNGGPTPSYNYLTHCGAALMHEWTGEDVFAQAIEKSTAFHNRFSYPDASFVDLIDERVRYSPVPRIWGLFGFSHTPSGRGLARRHMEKWLEIEAKKGDISPEALARHCENSMYWHAGPTAAPMFDHPDHCATMVLPGGVFRRGPWFIALSAIAATNPEDAAYRTNPFGLDRQKLFSVWHEKTGLIIDGSHSKDQPENSTFDAKADYARDYYPAGGTVGIDRGDFVAQAAYKSFFGHVQVRAVSDTTLQIELSVDPAGNRGPFTAGFTLLRAGTTLRDMKGAEHALGDAAFTKSGEELGGGFAYGAAKVSGPAGMRVRWPLSPFNSYAASGKSSPESAQVRVEVELTVDQPKATFVLSVE